MIALCSVSHSDVLDDVAIGLSDIGYDEFEIHDINLLMQDDKGIDKIFYIYNDLQEYNEFFYTKFFETHTCYGIKYNENIYVMINKIDERTVAWEHGSKNQ